MNSYERTMAAIHWEKVDRVPVIPLIIQHAMALCEVPHSVYSKDPACMAQTQINALKKYGYDGIHITTDNQVLLEAFGGKIRFPHDEPPQIIKRALFDKDLSKLPKVTKESGRMPVICEATSIARRELGDSAFIKTNIDSGPFSAASALCGEEAFLMNLYDDERFSRDLLELCSDAIITYGRAVAAAGAHALTMGDSTAGIIGAELYEKYALPFAKRVIDELKKTGLPIFYHVCGNTSHISHLLVQTGADVLEIDSMVPMCDMKVHLVNKTAIEGNVSTIAALLNGTPEQVKREARECIGPFGLNGGLILSSGCEVPRDTKEENVFAMVEAAREHVE